MVNKVYLISHRYDPRFTQLCIASIRYWYPNVDICLVKNHNNGKFSTKLLERLFNVKIIDAKGKNLGMYYGKFEALFQEKKERFFTMDNDCVFAGRVLDYADEFDTDFVVDKEQQSLADTKRLYFNPDKARELSPGFPDTCFTFNMGQWRGTSGMLKRSDIQEVLYWNEEGAPVMRYPGDFPMFDQSVFNYLLNKKSAEGIVSVSRVELMYYPKDVKHDYPLCEQIKLKQVLKPRVIHWAGLKRKSYKDMNLSEILLFYNKFFYDKLSRKEAVINRINIWLLELEGYLRLDLGYRLSALFNR